MKLKLILALITIYISSCATTEYITPKIKVNDPPIYPTVKAAEYQCMDQGAKKRLQMLLLLKNERIEHLETQLKPYE